MENISIFPATTSAPELIKKHDTFIDKLKNNHDERVLKDEIYF